MNTFIQIYSMNKLTSWNSELSTSISWTEAKRELEDLLKDQKSLSEDKSELQKQLDRECRFYYRTGLPNLKQ